jgi:AcrR family transcriptional regulator
VNSAENVCHTSVLSDMRRRARLPVTVPADTPIPLRRVRERELVEATRALFYEHGMQEASIEQIASAVGIARGLIYRQFSSKEELHVLTVTHYLDEPAALLQGAVAAADAPVEQAEGCLRA